MTSPWTEGGATWNNQPSYDARIWDVAYVGDSFYTGWIDWDATELVREHASGSLANLGWLFRMSYETAGASLSSAQKQFRDRWLKSRT